MVAFGRLVVTGLPFVLRAHVSSTILDAPSAELPRWPPREVRVGVSSRGGGTFWPLGRLVTCDLPLVLPRVDDEPQNDGAELRLQP